MYLPKTVYHRLLTWSTNVNFCVVENYTIDNPSEKKDEQSMKKCPTDVFDGLDRVADLHVDVAVEDSQEDWAVGDDPLVGNGDLFSSLQNRE